MLRCRPTVSAMRSTWVSLAVFVCITVFAGCGWRGRGRAIVTGRPPYDVVDPSGRWIAEGNLPWGSGHTLDVTGPGPAYRVARYDASGQPIAFGIGVAEAGHFYVGYTGALEASQVAVYQVGATDIEGVWADGRSTDIGTEEWRGIGAPDPFTGVFTTYGTNPGGHDSYRMRVAVRDIGAGVYDVRWGSGHQEFLGAGIRVGDRFVTAAVLTYSSTWTHTMWSQRGYALGAYDLTAGGGVGIFRASADGVPVVGVDAIRRL